MKTTNNVRFEIIPATGRNLSETERNNIVSTFDMTFFWMKGINLSFERMIEMLETKRDFDCKRYDAIMKERHKNDVPNESIAVPNKTADFRNFYATGRVTNTSSGTDVRATSLRLAKLKENIRSGKGPKSYAGDYKKLERTFAPWYWIDWTTTPEDLLNCSYNIVPEDEIYRFLLDKTELSDIKQYCLLDKIIERAIRKIAGRGWKCSVFCSILLQEYDKGIVNVVDVSDVKSIVSLVIQKMIEKGELSAYYGNYGKYSNNSDDSDIILVFAEFEHVIDEEVVTTSAYGRIVKAITNFAARCQRYNEFAGKRLYIVDEEGKETEYYNTEKEYFNSVLNSVDLYGNSPLVAKLREEIGHIGRFYHKMAPDYHKEFEYWLVGKLQGYNLKETAELYEIDYRRLLRARDFWQNGVICQKNGKKFRSEPLFKLYTRKYRKIK